MCSHRTPKARDRPRPQILQVAQSLEDGSTEVTGLLSISEVDMSESD